MLRAYDQETGKEVGNVLMPARQSGSPMTYMVNGKQYIIVAVSGGNYSGEYIATPCRAIDAAIGHWIAVTPKTSTNRPAEPPRDLINDRFAPIADIGHGFGV